MLPRHSVPGNQRVRDVWLQQRWASRILWVGGPLGVLRRVLPVHKQGVRHEQVCLLRQFFPQQQMPEEPGECLLPPGRRSVQLLRQFLTQ